MPGIAGTLLSAVVRAFPRHDLSAGHVRSIRMSQPTDLCEPTDLCDLGQADNDFSGVRNSI